MMEITLGKRIASLRKEKELKQDELAEILGLSPQAVSKWENDITCPDISVLPKLSKTLGVSVDELLCGKSESTAKLVPIEERKDLMDMILRIVVNSSEGNNVRVNLPMALVQAAVEMGLEMPQISGNDSLKNINFSNILELVKQGAIGNLVEVESADGDTVYIFVE